MHAEDLLPYTAQLTAHLLFVSHEMKDISENAKVEMCAAAPRRRRRRFLGSCDSPPPPTIFSAYAAAAAAECFPAKPLKAIILFAK